MSIKICALQHECGASEVCVCFGSARRDPSSNVKALEPEGEGFTLYPLEKGNFTYNF